MITYQELLKYAIQAGWPDKFDFELFCELVIQYQKAQNDSD